jgi:hypothetical protein
MLPAGRVPIRIIDREQPDFPKGMQAGKLTARARARLFVLTQKVVAA